MADNDHQGYYRNTLGGLHAQRNIHDRRGAAFVVGKLSVYEVESTLRRLISSLAAYDSHYEIHPEVVLGDVEEAVSLARNYKAVIFYDNNPAPHYTLFLPKIKNRNSSMMYFDSFPGRKRLEAFEWDSTDVLWYLGFWNSTDETRVLPYQGVLGDLCGVYCLFVLHIFNLLYRDQQVGRNVDDLATVPGLCFHDLKNENVFFESVLNQLLPQGETLRNDFNIQLWALKSKIGEEFFENDPAYKQTQMINKLCEDMKLKLPL